MSQSASPNSNLAASQKVAPRLVRLGALTFLAFLSLFVAWSWLAPLSSAVVARGVIKAEGNRKTVQHQEGGIIKTILVKDGDQVRASQVLMVLDDERVSAGFDQLGAQLDSERAKESRLRAESELATAVQWPSAPADKKAVKQRLAELIAKESEIFRSRRQSLDKQVALLQQQSSQIDAELRSLSAQIAASSQALSFVQQELKITRELADQGFLQKTRVMNLERDASAQTANMESARAELAKAQQRKTDLELRAVLAKQDYSRNASEALKESVARRVDLEERLRPIADASSRQSILAPSSGTVVDLKFFAAGAVIGPREPILDIVPDQANLVVEAKVRSEDVSHISVGQSSNVRLQAAKQRESLSLDAKVTYVAADQTTDRQTGQSFFTVQLGIDAKSLSDAGNPKLLSGIPVEVFVEVAPRNLLQYLFEPLTSGFQRGMRER
jgi:HlyD family type I secretion membrane fusion protein